MSELHYLVVLDTDTGAMRVGSMAESPVDSDEIVYDHVTEEWRQTTEAEELLYEDAELALSALIAPAELSPRQRAAALLTDTDIAGILAGAGA